ncbi:hypothetical protein PVAR5_2895 [Paecilomyces variotii No. 5]|uniref:Mid2 domain-containing protein n=1 Tax=Byssochlamys spectabilis (strain No. 5 / NBRC 109023) TaxID=1356009 RepID=V5FX03_BYSSN|nr:hypothetical protein PVAR5_2895 [Paecilomyces variotii No. 5]
MHKVKLAIMLPLIVTVVAWPFRLPVSLRPAVELSLSGASSFLSEEQDHGIHHVRRDSNDDTRHGYILSKLLDIRADTDTTTATTATTEAATAATSTSDTATTTTDTTATSTTTSETSSTTSSTASSTTAATTSATTSSTSTTSSTTTASTSSSSTTTTTASKTSSTTSSSASCAATATSSACVALRKFNHDGEMRAIAVVSVLAGVVLAFILWRYITKRKQQGRQQQNRMSQRSTSSTGSAELLTGEAKTLSPEEKQRYRESLMFMDERSSNPRSGTVSAVGSRRNSSHLANISPLARGESSDSANMDIALEPLRPAHT